MVYLVAFRLLGVQAWIPNLVLVWLGVGMVWVSVVIARKLWRGWPVFLPGLLFLTFAFRTRPDASHHWYSSLASLAATAVLIEKRTPARLAAAGALCGLASWFTQTRGAAAVLGLLVFLWWDERTKSDCCHWPFRSGAEVLSVYLATVLGFSSYFAWRAGPGRFFSSTVGFVVRYWSADTDWNSLSVYMSELPTYLSWNRLPGLFIYLFIHALLPLVYIAFFFRYRHWRGSRPNEPWDRLMLVNLVGLSLFLGIASAPNLSRLCAVSLPALIVLVWLIRSGEGPGGFLLKSLGTLALALAILSTVRTQIRWRGYLDLPIGRAAFQDPIHYEEVQWLLNRTRAGEFFYEAYLPEMYFPLALRNPAPISYVTPTDFTRPEQVQAVIEGLDRHSVRYVVWSREVDLRTRNRPQADHLGPLRAYLWSHYRMAKVFSNFDVVWERIQ